MGPAGSACPLCQKSLEHAHSFGLAQVGLYEIVLMSFRCRMTHVVESIATKWAV